MVIRVLVFLLLSQPVYVALGMELEGDAAPAVSSGVNADPAPAQNTPPAVLKETPSSGAAPQKDEPASPSPAQDTSTVATREKNTQTAAVGSAVEAGMPAVDEEYAAAAPAEDVLQEETDSVEEQAETPTIVPEDTTPGSEVDGVIDDVVADTTDEHGEGVAQSSGSSGTADPSDIASTEGDGAAETEDGALDDDEGALDVVQEGGGDADTTGEEVADEDADVTESAQEGANDEVEDVLPREEVKNVAQNPNSKYIFGEGDCTLVADGEFYCVAESPQKYMTADPRVYAEKDREGDREIFYFDGVEIKRITNNAYDDFAPVFDADQKRIVWQAMLNDRLQVMYHDLVTNTTLQVTDSRQNSSNPHIEGGVLVWQEWQGTNWEIMMVDADTLGTSIEIEQLTDNAVHDMFPRAYDGLVTWQREKGSSWEVIVYDIRTGKEHALEKNEDTKYENPRFVLLFDSKHDNGDVETIGYDLETGEMMELGTKSRPIPADPRTPKDEAPDALPREASNTTVVKVGREDDGEGNGDML